MRYLIIPFLSLIIKQIYVESCTGITPDGTVGPVGPVPGGGLKGILGGTVTTSEFTGGGSSGLGSGISSGSELNCDRFDASCKWRNGVNGIEDDHDFKTANGAPDQNKLRERTGTSTLPVPPFLAVHPDEGRDPSERAFLVSAPILCQQTSETLTFRYWLSQNAVLRVCKRRIGDVEPTVCLGQLLSGKAGPGPAIVSVPGQPDPFEITPVIDTKSSLSVNRFTVMTWAVISIATANYSSFKLIV